MASMVIYNAKVYLERDRFAQAILIEGDRIRAVGSNEGILAAAPADAERYDAAGRTIVPGFNDSHQHLQMVGELLGSIQLLGACGIGDVQQRVRDFIARTNPAPGTVLHGMGWNQDYFTDESRLLTRADLDAVSTDFPIILERACGHILVANTAAIERAGITPDTPAVEGGAIDHDANGQLTGIFRENACQQVLCIRPERTVDSVAATLRLAMNHAAECGITSVQTMDLRPAQEQGFPETAKRIVYGKNHADTQRRRCERKTDGKNNSPVGGAFQSSRFQIFFRNGTQRNRHNQYRISKPFPKNKARKNNTGCRSHEPVYR